MAKYIKKPQIVHAWKNDSDCLIETVEGTKICPGDWIIIDENGAVDCCLDLDFADMYDLVNGTTT